MHSCTVVSRSPSCGLFVDHPFGSSCSSAFLAPHRSLFPLVRVGLHLLPRPILLIPVTSHPPRILFALRCSSGTSHLWRITLPSSSHAPSPYGSLPFLLSRPPPCSCVALFARCPHCNLVLIATVSIRPQFACLVSPSTPIVALPWFCTRPSSLVALRPVSAARRFPSAPLPSALALCTLRSSPSFS